MNWKKLLVDLIIGIALLACLVGCVLLLAFLVWLCRWVQALPLY